MSVQPPTKKTCLQCRARKVRCDGRRDLCSNCDRLGYECSFLRATDSASPVSLIPTRTRKSRRVPRACTDCHAAKSRCSGTLPTCNRCAVKGIACVYPTSRNPRTHRPDPDLPAVGMAQSSAGSDAQGEVVPPPGHVPSTYEPMASQGHGYQGRFHLLTRPRVTAALRSFFEHLHSLPSMALLHKPSIMRLYRTEEADPALIAAVVALASRLPGSSVEEMRVGLQCSEITRDLVDGSLGKPSLYRMQALVLLLHFQLWTGSSNDPLLLTAHLARCAFLLGLNREMGHAACHVQESRRRLMWSIYLLDVGLADGLQEYTVCPAATLHLRLPCMEDDFELGNESNSVGLRDAPGERLGIIAYYIRIISLHDDILRYTKRLIHQGTHPDACQEFFQFGKDLDNFQSQLPQQERFSQENLSMRAFSPRLPRFVMTHVWWNLCHCHLFRCFVPTVPHAFNKRLADCFDEQNVAQYQKRCLEHAITAALIFTSVRDLNSDTCILDLDMATCAWKTAEILLLSDESTRRHLGLEHADVLRHASVCLAFAQSMVGMYPTIEPLVDDLSEAVNRFSRGRPGIASLFVDRTASNQAVSKHSALYRACFIDDSFRLEEVHDSSDARRRQSWTSRMGNTPASMGQKTPGLESQSPRNTGRTPDIYTTLTEAAHGAHEPHDTFPWSGVVPNMWDPAALQGPFEGESHMGAANTALSSPSRDRQRDMSVSGLG